MVRGRRFIPIIKRRLSVVSAVQEGSCHGALGTYHLDGGVVGWGRQKVHLSFIPF